MIKRQGHYCFTTKDKYYLYDIVGSVIIEINKLVFDAIQKYDKKQRCDYSEQYIIDTLLKNDLLHKLEYSPLEDEKQNRIAYLTFAPTYKCNFRCTYCFADHGNQYNNDVREFTEESLYEMLNFFFYKAFPNAEQYRVDFVSGGEPLLGMNIIKKAIEYIEEYSKKNLKQVSVWLCTNGSLITEEIIEYFSFHNISIGISIDGRKAFNDSVRFDYRGKGTYDQICNGINIIRNNIKVSKKFKYIWGLCTATNSNCDFVDILRHMKELEFSNVQIRLVRSESNYNTDKIIYEYNRLCNMLYKEFLVGNISYFQMILNDNDQFGKVLKRIMLDHLLIRRCNAGINKITICPDGTIYPCDSLVGLEKFVLGNIKDHDIVKTFNFKNVTVDTISKCSDCDIRYLCGGDCYYNAYRKTGCQIIPDPEYCQIQRQIINLSIDLRFKMEKSNQKLYRLLLNGVKRKDDYSEMFG